ncbi:helix-turn-helix domain-containing protein [Sediminibacterium sp.]|uniref:helix-turn-helix domain-containing protein n=1 Tax=Sediminibacterium sp. TaxID=1917865 RepID=UPI003F6EE380
MNTIVYFFTVLKNNRVKIDRGQLLRDSVESSGISVTKLVKKIGISRSTYYNHISNPELPLDLLLKYGNALHINFNDFLSDLFVESTKESQGLYFENTNPNNFEEAIAQAQFWRNKYLELSEKYQLVLELQLKHK